MPTRETTASALSDAWMRVSPLVASTGTGAEGGLLAVFFFFFNLASMLWGFLDENLDVPQYSSFVVRFADRCGDVWTYKPPVALGKVF